MKYEIKIPSQQFLADCMKNMTLEQAIAMWKALIEQ